MSTTGKPNKEIMRRLDVAFNDMIFYGCGSLPCGWKITVTMCGHKDGGEAKIALIDPNGEDVSEGWDGDSLNVWSMVEFANEMESLRPERPRLVNFTDLAIGDRFRLIKDADAIYRKASSNTYRRFNNTPIVAHGLADFVVYRYPTSSGKGEVLP